MPAISLQTDYTTQALSLVMDGYTHICDIDGDRFVKKEPGGTTVVILHYDTVRRSWRRITHRILIRSD